MIQKDNRVQPSGIYRLLNFIMNRIIPRGFWRFFGQSTEARSTPKSNGEDQIPLQREKSMDNSDFRIHAQSKQTETLKCWAPTFNFKNGVKAILDNLPHKKELSQFQMHSKESRHRGGYKCANDKWSNEQIGNVVRGESSRPRCSVSSVINEKSEAFIRSRKEAMQLSID